MEITKKVAETSFRVSGFDLPNFVQKCLVFIFDQVASIVTKWINIDGSFFHVAITNRKRTVYGTLDISDGDQEYQRSTIKPYQTGNRAVAVQAI